jgi:hypothetical protein
MPCSPSISRLFARLALCAALAGHAAPALADGVDWTLKGFGTLAGIGTDTKRLGFRRDFTQDASATRDWTWDIDSRLGVQLDLDFRNPFHIAVQWVARNHAGNFFEQNLEWAFLRWRPNDTLDLRLGRIGADAFMLSDYRNVGYAYPWMRPPHEYYATLIPYHFDGGDITWRLPLEDDSLLTLKGSVGYSLTQVESPYTGNPPDDMNLFMFAGNLTYESGDWRTHLGYVQAEALSDIPYQGVSAILQNPLVSLLWPEAHNLAGRLSIQGKQLHYGTLGVAYDDGLWQVQSEASYIGSSNLPVMTNMLAGYLSVGRRFGHLTVYGLYGFGESLDAPEKLADPLAPVPALLDLKDAAENLLNYARVDQQSASLGLRWDVYENIALKAQWSHFWLGRHGTFLWTNPEPPTPLNVNVWSMGVDFVF